MSEIPPGILQRHPELVAVGDALEQHRQGQPITSRCLTCGELLVVTEVEAVGTLVVTCPRGHVNFRARRAVNLHD